MRLLSICSLFLFANLSSANQATLSEIEKSIDNINDMLSDAGSSIKKLQKNRETILENLKVIEVNQKQKNREMQSLKKEKTTVERRLTEAEKAQKDFIKSLKKDRNELNLVRQDIIKTKKKLAALQAAENALNESIEITDDNLEKIAKSSKKWKSNQGEILSQIDEVNFDLKNIAEKEKAQKKLASENAAAIAKWQKSKAKHEATLKQLKAKYRAAKRSKK